MRLDWIHRHNRRHALLAAPAFALAIAACGGGGTDVSSDVAASPDSAVVQVEETPELAETTDASEADAGAANEAATTDAVEASEPPPVASGRAKIVPVSADEAIANAETNQPTLESSENVLDIETLAVADGSVQTLRDVVDGDRPVLLWFFAPH